MNLVYSNKDRYVWLIKDEDNYYLYFIDNHFCEYAIQLNNNEIETVLTDFSKATALAEAFRNGTTSMKNRLVDIDLFRSWRDKPE